MDEVGLIRSLDEVHKIYLHDGKLICYNKEFEGFSVLFEDASGLNLLTDKEDRQLKQRIIKLAEDRIESPMSPFVVLYTAYTHEHEKYQYAYYDIKLGGLALWGDLEKGTFGLTNKLEAPLKQAAKNAIRYFSEGPDDVITSPELINAYKTFISSKGGSDEAEGPRIGETFKYSSDGIFDYLRSFDKLITLKIHRSTERIESMFRSYIYVKIGDVYLKYNNCSPKDNNIVTEAEFKVAKPIRLEGNSCSAKVNGSPTDVWFLVDPEDTYGETNFKIIDNNWTIHNLSIIDGELVAIKPLPKTCIAITGKSQLSLPGFNYSRDGKFMMQEVFPEGGSLR